MIIPKLAALPRFLPLWWQRPSSPESVAIRSEKPTLDKENESCDRKHSTCISRFQRGQLPLNMKNEIGGESTSFQPKFQTENHWYLCAHGVCVFIYLFIHLFVCLYIYLFIYLSMLFIHSFIHSFIYLLIHLFIHVYSMCVYVCMCVCVCMYVCMYGM